MIVVAETGRKVKPLKAGCMVHGVVCLLLNTCIAIRGHLGAKPHTRREAMMPVDQQSS